MTTTHRAPTYVGRRLRAARVDAKLTQADVAKIAGLSRPQVANIESGVSDTSLGTFIAITRAIGADPTTVLAEPSCGTCGDEPPAGFTCNACGATTPARKD